MAQNIKVLILEHEPTDIVLLEYEFQKSGLEYILQVVETQEAYEQALACFKPDVILSDYSLPAFDGLSAFELKQKVLPETPFIMISGYIGEAKAVDMIKMGVTDFVLKEKIYLVVPKVQRALKEVTERRQKEEAERQLQARDAQLRKIMDLSLDVICTLDAQGRFVTLSAAARAVWGFAPAELVGCKALDLVHPEDQEKTRQTFMDLEQGLNMVNFECRFIRKNKEVVTISWSARWDPEQQLGYCVARDVTDLKQAQAKIVQKEKRFRTLLRNSADGYTLFNADATVIERSVPALKVLQREKSELSHEVRLDLIHPDDLPGVRAAFLGVRQDPQKVLTIEARILLPTGSYSWVEINMQNQLAEPAVAAIVVNYRDISIRKSVEIALRASEAKLKLAQAIGHMGSWEVNLADESVLWSDEMYRMLGLEKDAVQPSLELYFTFIYPDDQEEVCRKWQQVKEGRGEFKAYFRYLRADGQLRHFYVESRYEYDAKGNPVRITGIQQDVTERKLAELALEKSEAKYRALFNLSPAPNWLFDLETLGFLDVNEAAIRHYGYSREEFLSMTLLEIRPPEEIDRFLQLAPTQSRPQVEYVEKFKHRKKNGEIFEVDIRSNEVELDGRKARAVVVTDISERIRYIQAIEAQNKKLRDIAWIQSHVVRAPLARLVGLVNFLEHEKAVEGETAEILRLISEAAQELDTVIREVVRKAEQVKAEALPEPADSEMNVADAAQELSDISG